MGNIDNTCKHPQYENCQVLNPDGELMFRTHNKKGKWYLDRNLAVKLSDSPLIVRLTFAPKGDGHVGDPYFLQEMRNRCVVCNSDQELTRHHIIPYCYRKHFPKALKEHRAYDVLPMCASCHFSYEAEAFKLKRQLGVDYNIDVGGEGIRKDKVLSRAVGSARAILEHGPRIPAPRLEELYTRIREYLKHEPTQTDLITLAETTPCNFNHYIHHGKRVMEQVPDVDAFILRWRNHFIDTMNPQYLPKHWMERINWKDV